MKFVLEWCSKVPMDLQRLVEGILQLAVNGDVVLLHQLDKLLDGLDDLLAREGFNPAMTLLLDKMDNH